MQMLFIDQSVSPSFFISFLLNLTNVHHVHAVALSIYSLGLVDVFSFDASSEHSRSERLASYPVTYFSFLLSET